jgi:hypothetical protein
MKHKVRRIHFVGRGGVDASREQGPRLRGCDRPRVAPAADGGAGMFGAEA